MPLLFNKTPCAAEILPLIDKEGNNVAVVIAKGSYRIRPDGSLDLVEDKVPLVFADEYVGDPRASEIRVPAEVVYHKPAGEVFVIRPAQEEVWKAAQGRAVSIEVGPVRVSGRLGDPWPFAPVRHDATPRKSYAGTYDQKWVEQRMPLLPADFDERFHQAAPARQIAPGYFAGDESFKLTGLYREGETMQGKLPGMTTVVSGNVLSRYFTEVARLDTVLVWVDRPMISLVWRHAIRPKQKIAEVCNVFVYLVRLQATRELFGKP